MPQPLQKSPVGLLELLRLRVGGRAPEEFSTEVRAIIDAVEFYGADLKATRADTAAAAAFPLNFQVDLPEPRLLYGAGAIVFMGAAGATRLELQLYARFRPGANGWLIAGEKFGACAAATLVPVARLLGKPLLLPAGSQLHCVVQSDAAGADHTVQINHGFLLLTAT